MNGTLPMSLRTPIEAQSEVSPWFNAPMERRLYQPYCVTEASSRCPSPESTDREPLRISYLADTDIADEWLYGNLKESELESRYIQYAASNHRHCLSLAITPRTGSKSSKRHVSSNPLSQPGNTSLRDTNHITQAVTPRGSHSLTSSSRIVCDDTLSHSRMQQSVSLYVTASRQSIRKTLPWHNNYAQIDYHPLPSVPEETLLNSKDDKEGGLGHKRGSNVGDSAQTSIPTNLSPWLRFEDRSKEQLRLEELHKVDTQHSTFSQLRCQDHQQISKHDVSFNGELGHLDFTTTHSNTSIQAPSRSPRPSDVVPEHTQPPSSVEPYISREQLSETTEARKACRRTQPRDGNFTYQFGQPPSRSFDLTKPTQSHFSPYQDIKKTSLPCSSPPKTLSTLNTNVGPRPPPWGSYDSLTLQRQQRNEARERTHLFTQSNQKQIAVPSVSGASQSSGSLGKDVVRREVDEYRRQVLSVYPELELNRNAEFERRRWCCVVM